MRATGLMFSALLLAACGSEPEAEPAKQPTKAETPKKAPTALNEGKCPFTETTGWYAQIENSRFSVDGRVDLLMAGYKPVLKKRSSAPSGEIALDLSLEQAPGGAVEPAVSYDEPGGSAYRRVTIHCGGKQVAAFEPLDQRL